MKFVPHSLALRPRLLIALAAGALLAMLLPGDWRWATRLLVAWDAGAVLYLGLLAATMFTETVDQIRARAEQQDEGAVAILVISCLAATASLAAIAVQLTGIGAVPAAERGAHLALGGVTILCSWTLLHAFFTLHYAGIYYRGGKTEPCLDFPGSGTPNYVDFLYFSCTIGCTSQTSDVGVTTRRARGVVLVHSILAFVFNTSILAMAINVGASLVSGGS
ncbi:hypothetical protein ASE61_21250 [Bosea sp. Root670]|jgi:uncharacterized membrane protein|uniref:Uncharacterized membrane protein n=1 Tax=Bosea robiniae TaxID=1036780 RepID=A0ABY0NZJ0_9HYPH|nr:MULTISPECIES: DUF1345 domain-containing protein [Bosea]KRE00560.1 hypothetical protein ASE61_21250 [Bosea sp. Root670]TQI75087.1 putative membrane protein [Bosea sp. AK1]SDG46952.1 Uncharacterized membrane protein [Bosea robiniae]